MNKQQLANKIWESANKMRSKIEANEYKDYILGFIFYKYLSDQEIAFLRQNGVSDEEMPDITEEDKDTVEFIQNGIGFFIAYENLFSTWLSMGKDFDVSNVRDALSAFSRLIKLTHEKVFSGIFDTLQTGLSKLGDSSATQTKSIRDLLYLIKDIPMDGKQDYDVLGFIYEYLIEKFAANAGKKAGEFYTPHEVSLLMSEIVAWHLREKSKIKIYDPTSGAGSLLINIGRCVAKHITDSNNIMYYAQELKQNTYNLTRMNLVMRGILPSNIITRCGDTLEDDWPYFDESDPTGTYDPLYVDAVVSNPPYSQQWDPTNKENDPRYSRFGLAPKSKADYAFLLHDLYHLKPDGVMTIVLPHGVLFRGGEEGEIRRNLIENNHIDAIIGLPANIFFGTGIPTIIMVLKQKRENTDVLIVDASKGFEKVGKNNRLRSSDIRRITDTVTGRLDIARYSKKVSRDEIRSNDYNLNIPRYVDSSETAESWDIYASMFGGVPNSEIAQLGAYWTAFPNLRDNLFHSISSVYSEIVVNDIKKFINTHNDVRAYLEQYSHAFADFGDYLHSELLTEIEAIRVSQEEAVISSEIFKRLEGIRLIDKYTAYQLLDDAYISISADIEILQTEGIKAATQVDPNMVLKKKNGKDVEVQDGWNGHIIPFTLIWQTLLLDEYNSVIEKENTLLSNQAAIDEILDSLTEEEKGSDCVNDAGDSFVNAAVKKKAKELRNLMKKEHAHFESYEFEAKIIRVDELLTLEKEIKSEISAAWAYLTVKTKETIENLTPEQITDMLHEKWIVPIVNNLNQLPEIMLREFVSKIELLASKYAITLSDVDAEIRETEKELCGMMDELTGSEFDMQGLKELQALLGGV